MAVGDVYRVIHRQRGVGNVLCLNIWYFEQTAGDGDAEAVNNMFDQRIAVPMLSIQGIDYRHTGYEIINMDNNGDFGLFPQSGTGTAEGSTTPNFIGYAFRINRSTRVLRNGRKTILGVVEPWMNPAGQLSPEGQVAINNWLSVVNGPLVDTNTGSEYRHVIVRLDKKTDTIVLFSPARGLSFVRISTQNSRKNYGN
jgi:hypothetical protein